MPRPTDAAPRGRHLSQQQAYGAPTGQQAGWDGSRPDTRGQPDDYYDGRQRGGVSEGSFARGGYGRGYGTGYSGNYGGYGFEPRLTPARPGPPGARGQAPAPTADRPGRRVVLRPRLPTLARRAAAVLRRGLPDLPPAPAQELHG